MSIELITRDLQEVLGLEELSKRLDTGLRAYWGTAPTGKIHIGYLVQMRKLADYLRAGVHVSVLIADVHATLEKTPKTPERSAYYSAVIRSMLRLYATEDEVASVDFVLGSSFQSGSDYVADLYRATTVVAVAEAQKAASENVKSSGRPSCAGLLYPIMQMLDEEYLRADIFCGGVDQRRISVFSRATMPVLGMRPRIHLLTPMVSGIRRKPLKASSALKMSASADSSRIGVLDSPEEIRKVIFSAYASPENPNDNSIREICAAIGIACNADEHPLDMKERVSCELAKMLASLRTAENLELQAAAYD